MMPYMFRERDKKYEFQYINNYENSQLKEAWVNEHDGMIMPFRPLNQTKSLDQTLFRTHCTLCIEWCLKKNILGAEFPQFRFLNRINADEDEGNSSMVKLYNFMETGGACIFNNENILYGTRDLNRCFIDFVQFQRLFAVLIFVGNVYVYIYIFIYVEDSDKIVNEWIQHFRGTDVSVAAPTMCSENCLICVWLHENSHLRVKYSHRFGQSGCIFQNIVHNTTVMYIGERIFASFSDEVNFLGLMLYMRRDKWAVNHSFCFLKRDSHTNHIHQELIYFSDSL